MKKEWVGSIVEAIRDICYEGQEELPDGVQYMYCDDEKYATIKIDDVRLEGEWIGCCLYIQWYKTRAYTNQILILGDGEPREPIDGELLAVIKHYKGV